MDFSGEPRIWVSYIPHCDKVPNKSRRHRDGFLWAYGGVWGSPVTLLSRFAKQV